MWGIASAYFFQDLLCACLKCYGRSVVLMHSGVPVRLNYLPVWGCSECFRNASRCITYCLQVTSTYTRQSVPQVVLQKSARCKYKTGHVCVPQSMDPVSAEDHGSRWSHRLWFQLPLPQSLILLSCLHSEWICIDSAGFWIRHGVGRF